MSKENVSPAVPHKGYLLKRLADPATAAAYVNAAASEEDPGALLQALRNVTEAHGGITKVAARAGLNRQQLYRTLSSDGNPELRSLTRILDATGLRLVVTAKPVRKVKKRAVDALAA
jgi:probable addiction module antidote protein